MKATTIITALMATTALAVPLAAPVKRGAGTVAYWLKLHKVATDGEDAYQAEEDAADPAAVLGDKMVKIKRGAGTVAYWLKLHKVATDGEDAYQAEEDAADPAAVLGEKMAKA